MVVVVVVVCVCVWGVGVGGQKPGTQTDTVGGWGVWWGAERRTDKLKTGRDGGGGGGGGRRGASRRTN